eukprot:scaffold25994_cov30-Tisochrysis_lutea.AAC.5
MRRVIAEEVRHVVCCKEGVIDGEDARLTRAHARTKHQPTDPAEAVDTDCWPRGARGGAERLRHCEERLGAACARCRGIDGLLERLCNTPLGQIVLHLFYAPRLVRHRAAREGEGEACSAARGPLCPSVGPPMSPPHPTNPEGGGGRARGLPTAAYLQKNQAYLMIRENGMIR